MKRLATLSSVLSLVLCALALVFSPFTRTVFAEGAQAFSISPPLIELQADTGQTVKASIKFTNVSDDQLIIKTQINDFGAKNETGEPNIIFDDVANTAYSLRQWIASPPPFKIGAHETRTVDFPITIPPNAEPGGHYAVIRFTGSTPAMEESGVALTASIGSLVLLQVSGQTSEKASVAEFFSAKSSKGGQLESQSFFQTGPLTFVERIRNDGNVHLKPTGTIEVKNMLGRTVQTLRVNGDPTDPNNAPRSILPESIRRFEQPLPKKWLIGRYSATIKLSYGQGQQPLEQTITFWVIPFQLLIIGLVVLLLVIFGLRWVIRRYNAYIIAKAGDGSRNSHKKKR